MARGLPQEVVKFLTDNPKELQLVRYRMQDLENQRLRPIREAEERERRAKLPLKPCKGGGYGCGTPTPGGYPCESCKQDMRADPDAYK